MSVGLLPTRRTSVASIRLSVAGKGRVGKDLSISSSKLRSAKDVR